MKHNLTTKERKDLIALHRSERVRKTADRIKAILLSDDGLTNREIARVLFLNEETVSRHISDYENERRLSNASGGSESKLNGIQSKELIDHLKIRLYQDANQICNYVKEQYGVSYSNSGMVNWLHEKGFSYKKPARIPAKASQEAQQAFISQYEELKARLPDNSVILFGDGVHPSIETKLTYGWIPTGDDRSIPTTASRSRINLFGAINLDNMDVIHSEYETINGESMCNFLDKISAHYPAQELHLILDQGPYNRCKLTQEKAKDLGIKIHLLPPYSPNLNPIERLWKIMNETVRDNVYFKSTKDFKEAILGFFTHHWEMIKKDMGLRINDNFQRLKFDTLI